MYKGRTLLVMSPCFTAARGIGTIFSRMPNYVDEVIVIDSNCADSTVHIAREHGALVVHKAHNGHSSGYQAVLAQSTAEIIGTFDCDGTYPATETVLLDWILAHRVDFVSARRFPLQKTGAVRCHNWLDNMILTWVMCVLWLNPMHDSPPDMAIFRREILRGCCLTSRGTPFSEEIRIEAMPLTLYRFSEYSTLHKERIGESKLFPFQNGVENVLFLFKLRSGLRRGAKPLLQ